MGEVRDDLNTYAVIDWNYLYISFDSTSNIQLFDISQYKYRTFNLENPLIGSVKSLFSVDGLRDVLNTCAWNY